MSSKVVTEKIGKTLSYLQWYDEDVAMTFSWQHGKTLLLMSCLIPKRNFELRFESICIEILFHFINWAIIEISVHASIKFIVECFGELWRLNWINSNQVGYNESFEIPADLWITWKVFVNFWLANFFLLKIQVFKCTRQGQDWIWKNISFFETLAPNRAFSVFCATGRIKTWYLTHHKNPQVHLILLKLT